MVNATPGPTVLGISQGDPAGIGPEVALKALDRWRRQPEPMRWVPLLFTQRRAVELLERAASRLGWRLPATSELEWLSAEPEEHHARK